MSVHSPSIPVPGRGAIRLASLAIASSGLLMACGGGSGAGEGIDVDVGGGGGSGPPAGGSVTLATKADVQREVGNLRRVFDDYFFVRGLLTPTPRAEHTTINNACELGGTSVITVDDPVSRTFTTFPVTVDVRRRLDDSTQCRESFTSGGMTYTTTVDARTEDGESQPDANNVAYGYRIWDRGGVAYRSVTTGPDGYQQTTSISGGNEVRGVAEGYEAHSFESYRFDYSAGRNVVFDLGLSNEAFVTARTSADQAYRFSGPLRYSTPTCTGGTFRVATATPLTFDDDGDFAFANGGSLSLTSGTQTVDVTFQQDGGAVFQVRGGSGATLTRAEIIAGGCEIENPYEP